MNSSMKNAINSAKNLIKEEGASCIVIKDGCIISAERERGIAPAVRLYDRGLLSGSLVVDKIIGRAAAFVFVLGGVTACHGVTVSAPAMELLLKSGISVTADNVTDCIINRKGDGMCPMEQAVMNITDPEEALLALRAKMAELKAHSE